MLYTLAAQAAEVKDVNFGEGALLSLIGFALVMLVLIVLMCFIYLMAYIFKKTEGKDLSFKTLWQKITKKEVPQAETAAPKVTEATAPGTGGEFKLHGVPPEIAAMAMAIVADELKTPVNELRFISIKEIKE